MHGQKRRRRGLSEFGAQLLEKQKLRWSYGVLERQFKRYFLGAQQKRGVTAQALIERLEERLDNVVYRMGLAASRSAARQMVSHGHILVNERRVNIPSYAARAGDVVRLRDQSRAKGMIKDAYIRLKKYEAPKWLSLDKERLAGKVVAKPSLEEAGAVADIQKIVEFYSR